MKSILLASVSVVAFAGYAAAEVSFSGSATFGFNDTDWDGETKTAADGSTTGNEDDNVGFYWESDLALSLSQELSNGLTAGVTFDIDIADDQENHDGGALTSSGFVLFLESEDAGIYFGDTSFAAQKFWFEDNVDEMAADGFSEQDSETVLRGDLTYGNVAASLSYTVADKENERPDGYVDQLSLGAGFEIGGYSFTVAYQEESDAADGVADTYSAYNDFKTDEIFATALIAQLVGVDAVIAYANNLTEGDTSLGILVNYPIGAVALRAYYVLEDGTRELDDKTKVDQEDAWGVGLAYENGPVTLEAAYKETNGEDDSRVEGTYDIGNGFMLWAGLVSGGNAYYVAGTVDLGNGAQLLVSYGVDDESGEEDEIGNPEIQEGATVEVTLAF